MEKTFADTFRAIGESKALEDLIALLEGDRQ
jgi:hypothetical protein